MTGTDREIRALYDFFEKQSKAGEIQALVDGFFTDDAIVTGHLIPIVRGRTAICGLFEHLHREQENVRIDMIETRHADEELIYNLADTHSVVRGPQVAVMLRSLCIFRRTNVGLRCEGDFFAMANLR